VYRKLLVRFARFARSSARAMGNPITFFLAGLIVVLWAVSGPLYGFNDSWQLFINTVTSLATFLMVFLIQNTQNRDSDAMQLKLDELIRAVKGANNAMTNIEELTEDDFERLRAQYRRKGRQARRERLRVVTVTDEVDQEVG